VLEAVFPNGQQATIAGFGTESEANEWLGSARHVAWLRDTRSAAFIRAVVATLAGLSAYAAILTAAVSEFLQSARRGWVNVREARGEDATNGATLALLFILALTYMAGLIQRVGKSTRWRSMAYRCLFAGTATLLIVSAVVAVLAAAVAPLGRSGQPAGLGSGTPQMSAAGPLVRAGSVERTERSDPIAVLIERESSAGTVSEPPVEDAVKASPPQPAAADEAATESPPPMPRHDLQRARPGFAGVWAPETGSCSARNGREAVLPAIISEHGARAGQTSCIFKNQRRINSDWRLLANCTNGRERWNSNVRLAVKGDRLIWTSERGSQAYIRCRMKV
jgi:hypothetical protein